MQRRAETSQMRLVCFVPGLGAMTNIFFVPFIEALAWSLSWAELSLGPALISTNQRVSKSPQGALQPRLPVSMAENG
jgi:hypothetical protein